ncbi:MAG: hypothetical protein AAFO69_02720, partial [Bacteroidota bacterium]
MLDHLKPYDVEYQDGSSRNTPPPEALSAAGLNFEQREVKDWLRFAQEFSSLLHYYNEKNELDGLWEGFLTEQLPETDQKSDQVAGKERFREVLIRYLEGQMPINASAELYQILQAPHRTLFLAFLKLLEQIKEQFNLLPQRHLDFHFRELLGLEGLPPIPDSTHVQLRLSEDADEVVFPEGTAFLANPNSDEELVYELSHMLPVSQASIATLLQIYLEKSIEQIADVRNNNRSDADGGFLKLMEFALGDSGLATKLAPLPTVDGLLNGDETIEKFHEVFQQALDDKLNETLLEPMYAYVEEKLFMTWQDFDYILRTQKRNQKGLVPYPNAWEEVYATLRRANLNKQSFVRKQGLRKAYDEAGESDLNAFNAVIFHAFAKGDLPLVAEYRNQSFELNTLLNDLEMPPTSERHLRAKNYIELEWYLDLSEFESVRATLLNDTSEKADWDEALILLEQAMRKCQGIIAKEPSHTDIGRLYHRSFTEEELSKVPVGESHETYPLFGENTDEEPVLGWQIKSPLFILKEGRRSVTCYLRLTGEGTSKLSALLKTTYSSFKSPVFHTSWIVESKEVPVEQAVYSFGNYLLKDFRVMLEYQTLTTGETPEIALNRQAFNRTTDEGALLLFEDGQLFEIIEVKGQRDALLRLVCQFTEEEMEEGFPEITTGNCLLYERDAIFYTSLKIQLELSIEF